MKILAGLLLLTSAAWPQMRVVTRPSQSPLVDFRIVFLLIALFPLFSVWGFLRLNEADGAEVSGHRVPPGAAVKAG